MIIFKCKATTTPNCSDDHHQPCLRAQRNKISEMTNMINKKMISGIHCVES